MELIRSPFAWGVSPESHGFPGLYGRAVNWIDCPFDIDRTGNPMSARDKYLKQFKAKLDEWNAELDKLEAEAGKVQADAKKEYMRRLEEVRQKRDELRGRYEEMERSSEAAFEALRAGAEDAWRALDESFRKSRK